MSTSNVRYATILTEEKDNLRIRYIANKHIFQNFNPTASYNAAYLSNIIGIENNTSVFTITDNWVGVGVTYPSSLDNSFQVNNQFIVGTNSVGINTFTVANSSTFNVFGTGYFSDSVGIGTNITGEKLRVDGNIQAFLFKARGADYAELEKVDDSLTTLPKDGTLIGFNKHGNVVTKYSESIHFGVVSHKPSLLGNEKILEEAERERCVPIVYLGKVEMVFSGDISIGDYMIPCAQEGDTIGVRIVPKHNITFTDFVQVIGYVHRRISESMYEVIVRI